MRRKALLSKILKAVHIVLAAVIIGGLAAILVLLSVRNGGDVSKDLPSKPAVGYADRRAGEGVISPV
jgi:putative copper export protein